MWWTRRRRALVKWLDGLPVKMRDGRPPQSLPCHYNRECTVFRRSPDCECTTRLEEEYMFVANSGKWIRAQCARLDTKPDEVRPCALRGPLWCQERCRDPGCPHRLAPDVARAVERGECPGRLPERPPVTDCWRKGCRVRRRRADCTCPDRPDWEAWYAKYVYKHWCLGPCRVYCDLRGPDWCRAHCENPRCLFAAGTMTGDDWGARHFCPDCRQCERPEDVEPGPCVVPPHLVSAEAERERREKAAVRRAKVCKGVERKRAAAVAREKAAAVKKCRRARAAALDALMYVKDGATVDEDGQAAKAAVMAAVAEVGALAEKSASPAKCPAGNWVKPVRRTLVEADIQALLSELLMYEENETTNNEAGPAAAAEQKTAEAAEQKTAEAAEDTENGAAENEDQPAAVTTTAREKCVSFGQTERTTVETDKCAAMADCDKTVRGPDLINATADLIVAVRLRMYSLKCSEVTNEETNEILSCYKAIDAELQRLLKKLESRELGQELKNLEQVRAEFEKICAIHDNILNKFNKKSSKKKDFFRMMLCGLWRHK